MELLPLDVPRLRQQFNDAQPFRWMEIHPFMHPDFAREVAAAYPSFEESRKQGTEFVAVNERRKVQITESQKFPPPVRRLHELLAGPQFLDALEQITGIPKLLPDPRLTGGGMHITGPGGRLDVHVDFNYVPELSYHRRLNILVYLNPIWQPQWGGHIELWDKDVKRCHHSFLPLLNRCVIFETSSTSFHGVQPVSCPPDTQRKSFAAYYYTSEAPADWKGEAWSTIFRARPNEPLRAHFLMPLERVERRLRNHVERLSRGVRRVVAEVQSRMALRYTDVPMRDVRPMNPPAKREARDSLPLQ